MTSYIYIKRLLLVTVILHSSFFILYSHAQQVLLDHDWYLAGEKMTVAVQVPEAEKTSKVAYVELCDADGLQASAAIAIVDGRGQGIIELPSTLHSGYYQFNMYTRMGTKAHYKIIPVINIMQKSPDDDITWQESTTTYATAPSASPATVPSASPATVPSASPEGSTPIPATYFNLFAQRPENEGHCIYARIHRTADTRDYTPSQIKSTLSVIGNEVHVFDGKMLDDSIVVFNTYGVNGRHSIVITAETFDKKPLGVDIINPYAGITPLQLPHLTFSYNRMEVEERYLAMQQAAGDTIAVDSTVFRNEIFSTKPVLSYNLDEYRQFRTVREVLLEYVEFVHRTEKYGVTQLYVYSEAVGYSDWPALVLLDGMPVADIDRLLKYDARRVHYISIYDDFYTFGDMLYKGIINIVTRTGKLTNYPPEKTSAYLVYNFPQKQNG